MIALLSLTSIVTSQMNIIFTIGDSVISFSAADTGAEKALYDIRKDNDFNSFSGSIGSADYNVDITTTTVAGGGTKITITSGGLYRGIRRTVKLEYQY